MVLLRQCYAADEEASFAKVRKVLSRRLNEAGDDPSTGVLKQWRRAHSSLLNQTSEELVQEQLIVDGQMEAQVMGPDGRMHCSVVRDPAAPAELLRTIWYGGMLHWGTQRSSIAAVFADPFEAAMWDLAARQSATDLAYFYMGVAILVERALSSAQD